ncbi:hypothetical protein MKX08_003657 [Trichoderma sp. CBMAI-0020]|nr:hypothetical protein MKX08_003657 [Trichoderma sp. CBMAI-0020]WOD46216.1 hypothetical protein [Trichoderma atroviride]
MPKTAAKMQGITQKLLVVFTLVLLATVAAIRVPMRLPDGVYELSTRKFIHRMPYFIARYDMEMYTSVNLTARTNDDRGPLVSTRHRCSRSVTAKHDTRNVTAAKTMLSNWCAMNRPRVRSVVVAVQGNEVWYMCTYEKKHRSSVLPDLPQSCAREEVEMVSDRLNRWCGLDKMAAVDIDDWALTYGRTQRNVSFCRRQQFRGPWWLRKASGIDSGPGPEEEGPEEEE